MPGPHISDQQVYLFMVYRRHHTQAVAAAKAGISERSARRIEKDPCLPSQKKDKRHWRTRADPLELVWPRVEELLKIEGIIPVTIFETVQDEFGEAALPDGARRTLERRIARWRALHGAEKEIFFPQHHEIGRQGLSDFTVCDELRVTIAGERFEHRLFHFRLARSGWEHAAVVLGGESFSALSEHLQDALWKLGGVPTEHRSDSLSAAYKNLDANAQSDFTRSYEGLCRHYGMCATRNNRGEAHENGSIESPNGHLKRRLDQALRRRGSRDFDALQQSVEKICGVDIEDFCDLQEPRHRDLVGAVFVFLNLLKGDAELVGQGSLAYPYLHSQCQDALAQIPIYRCNVDRTCGLSDFSPHDRAQGELSSAVSLRISGLVQARIIKFRRKWPEYRGDRVHPSGQVISPRRFWSTLRPLLPSFRL